MYRANDQAAYPAEGQSRLISRRRKAIRSGLPSDGRERVLADRAIGTSPVLMRGLMAMGWTLLFRVTDQSKIILPDTQHVTCYDAVSPPGHTPQARGLVFKPRGRIPARVHVL